jgi:hypothetical protein
MPVFILYSLDGNLAKSESHLHMQEILNFSPSVNTHLGYTFKSPDKFYKNKTSKPHFNPLNPSSEMNAQESVT